MKGGGVQSAPFAIASLKTAEQYEKELCLRSRRINCKYAIIILDILPADENRVSSPAMSDSSGGLKSVDVSESSSRLSRFANYLRPARQLSLSWTSAMLTVIFLILTIV